MLNNNGLMNYQQYLKTAKEDEMIFINELHKQGILFKEGLESIKTIEEELNILVITATACKDSATIMPFLVKLAELNDNISISLLKKSENEELLEKLTCEKKVPSIIIVDKNYNSIRKFVEFPRGVKDILINSAVDETQNIIDTMRSGKYNNLIQEDLIKFLTGKDYDYISFQRKDK